MDLLELTLCHAEAHGAQLRPARHHTFSNFHLFMLFEYVSKPQYCSHLEKMVIELLRKLLAKLDMQVKERDEGSCDSHCGPGAL